jgi:hypothetical protein
VLAQVLADPAPHLVGVGDEVVEVPYSVSHLTAVLGPHFSTPGTLSTVSPIRAR